MEKSFCFLATFAGGYFFFSRVNSFFLHWWGVHFWAQHLVAMVSPIKGGTLVALSCMFVHWSRDEKSLGVPGQQHRGWAVTRYSNEMTPSVVPTTIPFFFFYCLPLWSYDYISLKSFWKITYSFLKFFRGSHFGFIETNHDLICVLAWEATKLSRCLNDVR